VPAAASTTTDSTAPATSTTPEPVKVADLGSLAGAFAITSDGALLLGDGSKLWRLAHPSVRAHEVAGATREPADGNATKPRIAEHPELAAPELLADGLGDVYGVALDADGRLFVADWEGGRVLAIAGRRGEAIASGLDHPSGLAALAGGVLVVKESGRQRNLEPRLQRIARDGTVALLATLHRSERHAPVR
jgi:hypothetical protein